MRVLEEFVILWRRSGRVLKVNFVFAFCPVLRRQTLQICLALVVRVYVLVNAFLEPFQLVEDPI